MARFRRLCVDIDDWGVVVGGSAEYYDDSQAPHVATAVLTDSDVSSRSRYAVLDILDQLGWPQEALAFPWPPDIPSR